MRLTRRLITVVVLASTFIFLFHTLYRSQPASSGPLVPSSKGGPPFVGDDGVFSWTLRPQHYPLDGLTPLPTGAPRILPRVQYTFGEETAVERSLRLSRRDEVKATFKRCWSSYREKAWLRDELKPISGRGLDTFGGWAATLVDALDTLWIMDMKSEFAEAVSATKKIDFTTSTDRIINVFETTIRYLGGFLGAFDLSGDLRLIERATTVGEMLLVPFDTPNHLPITRWDWQQAANGTRQQTPSGMLVSELGSLTLEFTRLSQITGDKRWFDAVNRITALFEKQQHKTKLPGMWPVVVNPRDEDMTFDTSFTFGGMSDSLYEYFPKQFALLGGLDSVYQRLYEGSIKPAIEALFFRPMTPNEDDILISGDARADAHGKSYVTGHRGQHLGCFTGGMLGLGGRLFSDEDHVALAKKLTNGCIWAYKAMERGIMPEIAHFVPCESRTSCPWNESRWHEAILATRGSQLNDIDVLQIIKDENLPQGYVSITDKRYILRPEAIESVFIMWRLTGDNFYREAAWDMFNAIRNVSETPIANAAIRDITKPKSLGNAPQDDRMESFFLAETLKYFYLIFSEPSLVSLDEFVLNTEAHPLRRPVGDWHG